jgi:hypothetical protein
MDPALWKVPEHLNPGAQAIWHRCLSLFIGRGVLQPQHEHWLSLFSLTVDRTNVLREFLTSLPRGADPAEFELEEKLWTAMLVDQLSGMGFNSEQEFRNALNAQVQ